MSYLDLNYRAGKQDLVCEVYFKHERSSLIEGSTRITSRCLWRTGINVVIQVGGETSILTVI